MKVKAIKRGYDGIKVREVGEEFEFFGKLSAKWMEALEPVEAEVEIEAEAETKKKSKAKGE